ncbi:MAG: L-seryl-tRNA(Sec) selenium transferase, partial [Chloroflexi bacterium]|nr:L-seryl-tRNA(Sec) selenium transferase [Chloroflexota bacterium]
MDVDSINKRVRNWIKVLKTGELIEGDSAVGGGSLPGELLPTYLLSIKVEKPEKIMKKLRQQEPPIIARVQDDRIVFDPRTILDHQEKDFLSSLQKAFA